MCVTATLLFIHAQAVEFTENDAGSEEGSAKDAVVSDATDATDFTIAGNWHDFGIGPWQLTGGVGCCTKKAAWMWPVTLTALTHDYPQFTGAGEQLNGIYQAMPGTRSMNGASLPLTAAPPGFVGMVSCSGRREW